MRTKITTGVFAFFGLFAGTFSLWAVGNSIRYGVVLSHNWKLLTGAVCPPVMLLYTHTAWWPLLLVANVLLYGLFGYALSQLLYKD
ncbi:hypothetical protein [Terriglobus tenax]|uniref:hypothetical protein n=1 Tax=Terriglobus tenax TaxID=1111115 RepID=UPI0021DF6592|nr:hypothetical protein [Terriglobus tenax]